MKQKPKKINECIIGGKIIGGKSYIVKNRDRTYQPRMFVIHYLTKHEELIFIYDIDTKYIEGINCKTGIAIMNSALNNAVDSGSEPADEGKNIFNTLRKSKSVKECVKNLIRKKVYGHSLVSTSKNFLILEYCKGSKPHLSFCKKNNDYAVRTNHGYHNKNIGYIPGNDDDYISSKARMAVAEVILDYTTNPEEILPNLNYPIFGDMNVINPNRDADMKTTSQVGIDFNNKSFNIVDIPGRQRFCILKKIGDWKNCKPTFKVIKQKYTEPSGIPFSSWGMR